MSSQQGTPGAQAPGDQDEVARFLVELRALGEGEPPTPSRDLAALLGGATLLSPRRKVRRIVARSAIVAAAVVGALVVAAANHSLPQPAQRVVSNFVTVLTPFDITPNDHVAPTLVPSTPTHTPTMHPVAPGEDESSSPAGGEDSSSPRGGSEDGSGSAGGGGAEDGAGSGGDGATSAPRTAQPSGEDAPTSAPRTAPESGDRREPGDN